jgi:hypothetical protein
VSDTALDLIVQRLKEPFPAEDIEWRIQRSGKKEGKIWAMVLAYVTARAIQERLDEACGVFGWKNEYKEGPNGGVLCGISIADSEGRWTTKWDGAENTNIEAVKGGLSGAFKRAGAVWGIGRYLYNLEATFAVISDSGRYSSQVKDGPWFKWNPPALPSWALPEGSKPPEAEKAPTILTYKEIMDKLDTADNVFHLKKRWDKAEFQAGLKKLSDKQRKEVDKKKEGMKAELEKKAKEKDALAQDAERGAGSEAESQEPLIPEDEPGDPA